MAVLERCPYLQVNNMAALERCFRGHQYCCIREVAVLQVREVVFYRSPIWLHCKGGSYNY